MCRTPLDARRWKPTLSIALARLLANTFPEAYQMRAQQATPLPNLVHSNDDDDHQALPLFVLEPLLPGQRMYLHVFEMRYRFLVQHVMQQQQSNHRPQFGMVGRRRRLVEEESNNNSGLAACGTRVEIVSSHSLPDGRFQIVIQGLSVFRMVQPPEVSPFGYWQAHVEPVDLDEHQPPPLDEHQPHEEQNQAAVGLGAASMALNESNPVEATVPMQVGEADRNDSNAYNNNNNHVNDARSNCHDLAQQVLEQYHEWAKRVVENGWERHPDHLSQVLDLLGPTPPSTPGQLALWVAAAVNPLPPLGVAPEIRPAMLAARSPAERLQIVQRALDESLHYVLDLFIILGSQKCMPW